MGERRTPGGVLRRGRRSKAKAQHDTSDDAALDALAGGDSGLAAGGIALTEMEKWKHTWPEHEYQREKQQTKEKRTQRAATNKNDDLFRNMTLGGGRPSRADDDDAMDTQSVKSAPGGLGGGGASARRIRQGYGSRSVSGLGSDGGDEDGSQEGSGTSMPVSTPSSNLMAGGGGGSSGRKADQPARAVHFASVDGAGSEASFASSEDTSGTGGSSGFEPRPRPVSPSDEATGGEGTPPRANISPATSLLPDAPTTLPDPILKGPGSWYEIFPYCAQNSDGKYRTAVDELNGLAMSRPEPRKDLPAEPRTLGYVRLKVELELLSNPYSCYLRAPKINFHDYDKDELSIARLKANWLRLKMVLMPSHFVHRARDVARWQSIPVSSAVWSFWAYLSLMAPFWQYPVFFLLLFGVASASGRHNDRLLEEVVVWEDIADDDPDPFSFRHLGKIKKILLTVQKVLGTVASFGERMHYIFSFTDPVVTYVAMFVTVVFVLLASMALYALYNVAIYIGGRAILFGLGSMTMLPPRFSIFPWSKVRRFSCLVLATLRSRFGLNSSLACRLTSGRSFCWWKVRRKQRCLRGRRTGRNGWARGLTCTWSVGSSLKSPRRQIRLRGETRRRRRRQQLLRRSQVRQRRANRTPTGKLPRPPLLLQQMDQWHQWRVRVQETRSQSQRWTQTSRQLWKLLRSRKLQRRTRMSNRLQM